MLVETSVIIVLTSAALTFVAVALQGLYRVDHRIRDELWGVTARQRLATQLRNDAHQALAAEIDESDQTDAPTTLRLTLSEQTAVEYLAFKQRVVRRKLVAGEVQHRDAFEMPMEIEAAWSIEQDRATPLISLTLARADRVEQSAGTPG